MNAILTIAGGLIAVYILLALITAHLSEAIASLLRLRGRALYEGLRELLGECKALNAASNTNLVDLVYQHPLVNGLGTSKRKPSYVPLRTLTLSLVDVMRRLTTNPTTVSIESTQPELLTNLLANVKTLDASGNATARSLSMILQTAKSDYTTALKAIDGWFDNQMDRISGTYRRWSFCVQVILAGVLVVWLDADTLTIVQQLSRSATVAAAMSSLDLGALRNSDVSTALNKLLGTGIQLGWPAADTNNPVSIAAKIAGLALTWAAVLLGAPFWFDLLKKIVPVRLAGGKPPDPKSKLTDAQTREAN